MTKCPRCNHELYHQPPPLVKLPPLRVYCDGCDGWLAWQATERQCIASGKAPVCQACKKPMVLKNLRAGGVRWGCETWKACKTGMRAESSTVSVTVPVYELVPLETLSVDSDVERFAQLDQQMQATYERIEQRGERYKRVY